MNPKDAMLLPVSSREIGKAFVAALDLPPWVRWVELRVGIDESATIKLEMMPSRAQLAKLGAILTEHLSAAPKL